MLIEINDESINDLQRESIQKLVKHAKGAHYINVSVDSGDSTAKE